MRIFIFNLVTVLTFTIVADTAVAKDFPIKTKLSVCDASSDIDKYDENGDVIHPHLGVYTLGGIQAFLCRTGTFAIVTRWGPVEGELKDMKFSGVYYSNSGVCLDECGENNPDAGKHGYKCWGDIDFTIIEGTSPDGRAAWELTNAKRNYCGGESIKDVWGYKLIKK